MKKMLTGVLIGVLATVAWHRVNRPVAVPGPAPAVAGDYEVERADDASPAAQAAFRCDGRVRCSQMTSCDEAMFFLRNCPGVEMDGEGDGIPCEKQWCVSER